MTELNQQEQQVETKDIYFIEVFPTDALRSIAKPITDFGEKWQKIGERMIRTMYEYEGIGLAANQVGLLDRIIVMDCSPEQDSPMICLNPEILEASGEGTLEEGCLSAPSIRGEVTRPTKVKFKYQDPMGNEHVVEDEGLLAICVQHEIDHLNGIMFFDYLSTFAKNKSLDKLRKIKKNQERDFKRSQKEIER